MEHEHEQLHDRYLEGQLREQMGPEVDISERVLRAVYAKPQRRVMALPPRRSTWRPLAAAAAVLIAAGVATFALVRILPEELTPRTYQADQRKDAPSEFPRPRPAPDPTQPQRQPVPVPKDLLPESMPGAWPEDEPELESKPDSLPRPETPEQPEPEVEDPHGGWPPGYTDPPGSWPDPKRPIQPPEDTTPTQRAVLATGWRGESLQIKRDGCTLKWKSGEGGELLEGDRVSPKGHAEFTLSDGTLLRLEGELTFGGTPEAIALTLNDGALYADTASAITVAVDEVSARFNGVAVFEQRLHGMDVFCLSGSVSFGDETLVGGLRARLEKDGFGREKAIAWEDVQREFKFLKDAPARIMIVEELAEEPGKLFGGKLADGILAGNTDGDVGIGFYLREPYTFREGDVVRFRFRVEKACEMILQFGTVEDANWRHKMGGVKAGEWIEYELPLRELYKTTDVAVKATPGLSLKFFQLHPEDGAAFIEIDRVEIVHQP